MTYKVGLKGQVVIPKELRDDFGIKPGDRVRFWACDDHVALQLASSVEQLRGRFAGAGLSQVLTDERLTERESVNNAYERSSRYLGNHRLP